MERTHGSRRALIPTAQLVLLVGATCVFVALMAGALFAAVLVEIGASAH